MSDSWPIQPHSSSAFWAPFETSLDDIREVLSNDIDLKRVHNGHLSEYVENHEELEAAFGHCFEPWNDGVVMCLKFMS